jgi:hypothetical protein
MIIKSLVDIANELAVEIKLPSDCRIDIQWHDSSLVVSRDGIRAFAITSERLSEGNYLEQAVLGLEMLMQGDPIRIM